VRLDGRVPARLQNELKAAVVLDEPLPVHLGVLKLDARNVQLEQR
jgi:hypothetical protein